MEKIYKNEFFTICRFENSQAENVAQWMGRSAWDLFLVSSRLKYPLSFGDFLEYIKKNRSKEHELFSVFYEEKHIGHFELKNIDERHKNGTPAHIIISPEYRDKGLGKKLTEAINYIGFRQLGLERLSLSVHTVNFPATAAYIKAGYQFEGVIRNVLEFNGQRYSLYQMSILKDEYLGLHKDN